MTDGTGALLSQQRYLPFGGERTNLGTISQTDYGYTGQRDLDPSTGSGQVMGLMDYKARFYSPILGRFVQPDILTPGGPQGLNRYSYVFNRPVLLNDPTGHDPWWCDSATCERKYTNRYSTKSINAPLREKKDRDEVSTLIDISDTLENEAKDLRNNPANLVTNTVIGFVVGSACIEELGIPCVIAAEFGSNVIGDAANDMLVKDDADAYDAVADLLERAVDSPETKYINTLKVNLTPFEEAGGSLISVDEFGYQTLNQDFHELEYTLSVEGTSNSILLSSSQAQHVNDLFGGGLISR